MFSLKIVLENQGRLNAFNFFLYLSKTFLQYCIFQGITDKEKISIIICKKKLKAIFQGQ